MERQPEVTPTETVASDTGFLRRSRTELPEEGRFVPGTLLGGRYRVIGLVGEGGMGEVYRATDLTLGQSVALKFLPAAAAGNERLLERFQAEVRIARQVSHPNVCRVYDIGEVEGLPFISMEYVDGEDLATLLRRIGRLPADKALEIARRLCAGLAAAHDKGVIHRDLKPQNIMLNRRGEVLIMDFGLAAIADQLSGPEARNGTPAYMSPEQLKGTEVTARSDIYALGLVLYELFTGKRPFEAKTVQELIGLQESGQLTSMSSLASEIEPGVENIIRRCLDPNPARRPGSPLAVAAALPGGDPLAAALAAGETPSPEMVAAAGPQEGLRRRYALLSIGVVLLCLIAIPFLRQYRLAFHRAPLEYSPEVLAARARELAGQLGYPDRPVDESITLEHRRRLFRHFLQLGDAAAWDQWLAAESPVIATYREAPRPLLARPDGMIDRFNPPAFEPGMVDVDLDGAGRLRGFAAVPYAPGRDLAAPVPPETVFLLAGLEMAKFSETTPRQVPRRAADTARAWRGPHPVVPRTELFVEITWWHGRVTQVNIEWPWSRIDGVAPPPRPFFGEFRMVLSLLLVATGYAFAILLTRRNWKLGRIDRRGTIRLGLAVGLLALASWAGTMHAVPGTEMAGLLAQGAADSLAAAVLPMLIYMSLEPALRARWPHSIVTWNRVLGGRWSDPQVAAHVLIGLAIGLSIVTLAAVREAIMFPGEGLGAAGLTQNLLGVRGWVGGITQRLGEGVQTGLVVFFVLFGFRFLLRKDWIAAIAGSLVFASLEGSLTYAQNWMASYLIYVLVFTILMFVLLRVGLVASIAAVFFINTAGDMTLGTNWLTWYAGSGLATLALIAGVAVWAFSRSLGDQDLLGPIEREHGG